MRMRIVVLLLASAVAATLAGAAAPAAAQGKRHRGQGARGTMGPGHSEDAPAGKGAAEALRAAQRGLMAEAPHPFAWAAFGLTGMPR